MLKPLMCLALAGCVLPDLSQSCRAEPKSEKEKEKEKEKESYGELAGNRLEITRQLTLPAQQPKLFESHCVAQFEIAYYQADDRIRVSTSIRNQACAASHGEFLIRVRTVDESGEMVTRSFPEHWSRSDGSDVQIARQYPMAGASRLLWARIKAATKTACKCAPY